MTAIAQDRRPVRRSLIAAAVFCILGGLAGLGYLAVSVVEDLTALASAESDNKQWTVIQTEVEFLEFARELAEAVGDDNADLSDMTRRFDVFYSRMTILRTGTVYRSLYQDPAYSAHFEEVSSFVKDAAAIIDGPAETLRTRLPDLVTLTDAARPAVRSLATTALANFAADSESRRNEFAQTLLKLALALLVLLAALLATIIYMRWLASQASLGRRKSQQAAERTETVIQTSLDGVIVADEHGHILGFNAAAERIFGHQAKDVIGTALGPLIVPDHMRDAHEAGMKRMRENGEKRVVGKGRVQLEAKHKSGAVFPVELAIQSATTDQGTVFIAFLRDITAQVRAEQELVEARDKALAADRLKTEFLATMSHEIRTPLNGLLGNLALMQDTRLNPAQKRYARNMVTSGELLLQHVTDVLDLSRYDVDNLDMRQVPVNLSRLIQSIVDSQSGPAAANNTVIEWDWLGERHDWVISDPDALQHIFMNLVSNAVKFTRDGRVSVTLDATPAGDGSYEFIIHVSDTGQGIAPDLIGRIFDDFVTGSVAYDRTVGGTGLGLGIVRRSVKALKGEIDVESEVGVGSTFEVRLPLELTTHAEVAEVPQAAAGDIAPRDILIVEDNEINRAVARELLAHDGHRSFTAPDGRSAVAMAAERRFDLILMDISMPVMDGRTATRAIRSGDGPNAQTPIVALTANAMKSEQAAFLSDGMNGTLTKPLSRQALRQELRRQFGDGPMPETFTEKSHHADDMREIMGEDAYEALKHRFVGQVNDLHHWLAAPALPPLPEIAEACHKIAGAAGTFGAEDYGAALTAVEQAAKSGDAPAVTRAVARLEAIWTRTAPAL